MTGQTNLGFIGSAIWDFEILLLWILRREWDEVVMCTLRGVPRPKEARTNRSPGLYVEHSSDSWGCHLPSLPLSLCSFMPWFVHIINILHTAPTNTPSVSIDLLILDVTYQWSRAICDCLLSFVHVQGSFMLKICPYIILVFLPNNTCCLIHILFTHLIHILFTHSFVGGQLGCFLFFGYYE